MKMYPNIDYRQRPASYWEEQGVLASLLRDVKGTERRKLIIDCWNAGVLEGLPEELLKNTLGEEARKSFGRIHPACMGGEYLPDYEQVETEIARLELRSTTADVISIRARQKGWRIRYRIVDEYDTEFEQPQQSSRRPLTLHQLVSFIDGSSETEGSGMGLALCYNYINADGGVDRASLRHFTTVRSVFYPQLEQHYDHLFEEWVGWAS